LINYSGKSRDVFTLAHEIGHAIHSISASIKSLLVSDAPLPLAETASTFSELLLYDNISTMVNADEKKIILSEKIDDFYATIGRQSFFTLFENAAHEQISSIEEEVENLRRKITRDVADVGGLILNRDNILITAYTMDEIGGYITGISFKLSNIKLSTIKTSHLDKD